MGQVTLNSDRDAYGNDQAPDTNYNGDRFLVGFFDFAKQNDEIYRSYVRFDLSSVPAGAIIDTTSTLTFREISGGPSINVGYKIRRMTESFTESQATWNDRKTSTAWTTAGGTSTATNAISATWTSSTATDSETGSGLKTLIDDAIDNRADILWLHLFADTESGSNYLQIASSEHTTSSWRPELVVDYHFEHDASSSITGTASVSAGGEVVRQGDAALTANAATTADPQLEAAGVAGLTATASVSATAELAPIRLAQAGLTSTASTQASAGLINDAEVSGGLLSLEVEEREILRLNMNAGVLDSSGYARDFTVNGGITESNTAKYGHSRDFNGSTGYLSRSEPSGIAHNLVDGYCVAFWFYADNDTQTATLYCETDDGSANSIFRIRLVQDAGDFKAQVDIIDDDGTSRLSKIGDTVITADEWHHLFWTDTGGTARLYINGLDQAPGSNFDYTFNSKAIDTIAIGALRSNGAASDYFNGKIDEVRSYSFPYDSSVGQDISNDRPRATATITATANIDHGASASLTARAAVFSAEATASLSASATVASAGEVEKLPQASLSSVAAVAAAGEAVRGASAALVATATIDSSSNGDVYGSTSLTCRASIAANANFDTGATAALNGTATVAANATGSTLNAVAALAANAFVDANPIAGGVNTVSPRPFYVEVFEPGGSTIKAVFRDFRDGELRENENEPPELTFTVPADAPGASTTLVAKNEVVVRQGHDGGSRGRFIISELEHARTGGVATVQVVADGLLSQLADEVIVDYSTTVLTPGAADGSPDRGKYIREIVSELLRSSAFNPGGFQVNPNPIKQGLLSPLIPTGFEWREGFHGETILEAFQKLREHVGGFIRVTDARRFDWFDPDDPHFDIGAQIRYQKNLKGIRKRQDSRNHVTRLYAYGAGRAEAQVKLSQAEDPGSPGSTYGLDYIDASASAISAHGIIQRVKVFPNISDPDALYEAAQAYVTENENPSITYDVDALDLSMTQVESGMWSFIEFFQLGENVRVIDEDLNINIKAHVTAQTTNLLDLKQRKVTISTQRPTLATVLQTTVDRSRAQPRLTAVSEIVIEPPDRDTDIADRPKKATTWTVKADQESSGFTTADYYTARKANAQPHNIMGASIGDGTIPEAKLDFDLTDFIEDVIEALDLTTPDLDGIDDGQTYGRVRNSELANGYPKITEETVFEKLIGAAEIDTNAVGSDELASDSTSAVHLQSAAVESRHLSPAAVGRPALQDDAVGPDQIDEDAVQASHILNGAVKNHKIPDGEIDASSKLLDSSVSTSKIRPGAVDSSRLATNAVAAANIQVSAVIGDAFEPPIDILPDIPSKIYPKSIGAADLADASIGLSHISQEFIDWILQQIDNSQTQFDLPSDNFLDSLVIRAGLHEFLPDPFFNLTWDENSALGGMGAFTPLFVPTGARSPDGDNWSTIQGNEDDPLRILQDSRGGSGYVLQCKAGGKTEAQYEHVPRTSQAMIAIDTRDLGYNTGGYEEGNVLNNYQPESINFVVALNLLSHKRVLQGGGTAEIDFNGNPPVEVGSGKPYTHRNGLQFSLGSSMAMSGDLFSSEPHYANRAGVAAASRALWLPGLHSDVLSIKKPDGFLRVGGATSQDIEHTQMEFRLWFPAYGMYEIGWVACRHIGLHLGGVVDQPRQSAGNTLPLMTNGPITRWLDLGDV